MLLYICYLLEINQKEMTRQLIIRQLTEKEVEEREGNVHYSVVSNTTKKITQIDKYLNTIVCNCTMNTWNCQWL